MTQQEYANDLLRQGISEDEFVLKMQEYKPEDNFIVEEEEVVDVDEKTKKEKRKEKRKNKKLEVEEIVQPTPTGFDAYELEVIQNVGDIIHPAPFLFAICKSYAISTCRTI